MTPPVPEIEPCCSKTDAADFPTNLVTVADYESSSFALFM